MSCTGVRSALFRQISGEGLVGPYGVPKLFQRHVPDKPPVGRADGFPQEPMLPFGMLLMRPLRIESEPFVNDRREPSVGHTGGI